MIESRNTLLFSSFLFLGVVLLLRLSGSFFEENIVQVLGSVFGARAENVPVFSMDMIDFSALNPMAWSFENVKADINLRMHDFIDSVLPAFISTMNVGAILTILSQAKGLGMVLLYKIAPVIAL